MNKKNVDYILSSTDGIELLANLFQNGMALDLVDVTRARDNIDLPEDERHIYDMADAALDRVDLDKLYENAGDFELQDKYPEFFDYLQSLQRDRENDEPERVREDEAGEAEEEIEEELEEGIPEPLLLRRPEPLLYWYRLILRYRFRSLRDRFLPPDSWQEPGHQ